MRVVSKRQRRHRRRESGKRALRLALTRVLPLVCLFAVLGELWPRAHAWLRSSPHFEVKRIAVSGNDLLTPRDLVRIADLAPGIPLLDVRPEEAEGRLRLHPRILRAEVGYVFPRALRVWVEERRAVALVETDGLVPISRDGVLLPAAPERVGDDLPVLLPPPEMAADGHLVKEQRVLEALDFLEAIELADPALARSVSIVDVTDARFARVYLDTLSTALVYESGGKWAAHVRALPAVIGDLARDGAEGCVLDLRFRETIVRRGGSLARNVSRVNAGTG